MKSLSELAELFMTDKRPSEHNYTKFYDFYFSLARNMPITIVEIGILDHWEKSARPFGAASLRMWAEFFPNAEIHGIDILDLKHLEQKRIRIHVGDQTNPEQIQEIFRINGIFPNIIIDDGSHSIADQQKTLSILFKHLLPGGIYVVEDIVQFNLKRNKSALVSSFAEIYSDESATPMVFTSNTRKDSILNNTTLSMLMRYCLSGLIKTCFINPDDSKYLEDNIDFCNIHRSNMNNLHIAFIAKK